MSKMSCGECGAENDAGEHWCVSCGAFLEVAGTSPSSPAQYQGAVAPGPDPISADGGLGVDLALPTNAIACPVCGTLNDPSRYYCRIGGHELRPYREAPPTAQEQDSWWARLSARLRGSSGSGPVDRAKAARRQFRGLSRYTRNFRRGLAVGVAGLLVVAIAPGPRRYVTRALKDVALPDRHVFADVAQVDPLADQWVSLQWDPTFIADNSSTTAWAAPWPGGGVSTTPGDGGCLPASSDPGITVRFAQESDVDRLRVWAGTWKDDPAREQRPRPRLLEIRNPTTNPARCDYLELADEPGEQVVDVSGIEDVSDVEVRIVAVWAGTDPENMLVALSEIWFERSR